MKTKVLVQRPGNTGSKRISRRQFLGTSSAAVAASQTCAGVALRAAERQANKVPCIDCQSHLFAPEIVERMRQRQVEPMVRERDGASWVIMEPWNRKILPKHMDVSAKLADMDAAGIERTALSINDPGPEWFGEDAPEVARIMNDFIAGIVRQHPARFVGLCVLPLLDEGAGQAELDRCVKQLGMKGILLYTNLVGRFPDEPQFRWLFARAVELNIPVLLHPAKPVTSEIVKQYEMISGLGNMFDNTIALARVIMAGILDQHPSLKLVCPHLGGTLPYIIGRLDHQTQVLKRGPKYLTHAPSEYLKQVWFDIVSPLPAAMRFAVDYLGADRLLYSSDHPWVEPQMIMDALEQLKLPDAIRQKIYRDNARKLFGV